MTWEELSQSEKDKWSKISSNLNNFQKLYITLSKLNKCIWCSKKIEVIKKRPEQNRTLNPYDLFTTEFLVHTQTTHGYTPEDLLMFIEENI